MRCQQSRPLQSKPFQLLFRLVINPQASLDGLHILHVAVTRWRHHLHLLLCLRPHIPHAFLSLSLFRTLFPSLKNNIDRCGSCWRFDHGWRHLPYLAGRLRQDYARCARRQVSRTCPNRTLHVVYCPIYISNISSSSPPSHTRPYLARPTDLDLHKGTT